MAKLSSDKTYVTVEKNDTLTQIAVDYAGGYSKYKQLAAINNISDPNKLYVGQKIYLSKTGSGSSSSSSSSTNSNKAKITHIGFQNNSDSTIYVTWEWDKKDTKEYAIKWKYATDDGVGFVVSDTTTKDKFSTYSGWPQNATRVVFWVKPISKTKKVNDKETDIWKAEWNSIKFELGNEVLTTPSSPSIEIEGTKLTASVSNYTDANAKSIEFQLIKNNSSPGEKKKATLNTGFAETTFTVSSGNEYTVRCRAIGGKYTSEWSSYPSNVGTPPKAPKEIITIKALSETSVQLDWTNVSNAKSYEVQHTKEKMYFDSSPSNVTSTSIDASAAGHAEITGLESGDEYFFRVRAVNDSGNSAWTPIKSIIIGKEPAAPTTWSSTTTAITGESVTLYWVHNAQDGSSQTYAELELLINGVNQNIPAIKNTTDEDEKDKTSFYTVSTSALTEGAVIKWRVRTKGILNVYGDWSVERKIDVYAQPTVELSLIDSEGNDIDELTSFPFYVKALAGPSTQMSIGYHVNVIANETYEALDSVGNSQIISAGDSVYSRFFDSAVVGMLEGGYARVELSAGNIDLQNGISYTVICTASMDSGLSGESSVEFTVNWADDPTIPVPNAEIHVDEESYSATIRPYCENHQITYRNVTADNVVINGYTNYFVKSNVKNLAWGSDIIQPGERYKGYYFPVNAGETWSFYRTEKSNNRWRFYWVKIQPYDDQNTPKSEIKIVMDNAYDSQDANTINTYTVPDGYTYGFIYMSNNDKTGSTIPNLMITKATSEDWNPTSVDDIPWNLALEDLKSTAETFDSVFGEVVKDVTTTTGETVYYGASDEETDVYYTIEESSSLVEDITLSVYRREFDGDFTEIATNLNNTDATYITDPHPALDYARYRIVATSKTTGSVSYYDMPNYPVGGIAVIIQWDEEWRNFQVNDNEDELDQPPWSGSLLSLPYNIDVSDKNALDVELIEYIGRKRPVSYYGTQLGESATWNMVIPKDDKETLYALRCLAIWPGDVYVREPSGSGYWANVAVSFSQKHLDVTIPVTLDLTRVEGGM